MNWLLICIAGIFIVGAITGFVKGALKIAVSLLATLLTMMLVFFATPYLSRAIISFTPFDEMIEEQVLKIMTAAVTGQTTGESGFTEEQVRAILDGAGVSEEELNATGITVEDIVDGKVSGEDLAKYGISSGILSGHRTETAEESLLEMELPRQTQIEVIENAELPQVFKDLLLSNNNNEIYRSLGVSTFVEYVGAYLAKIVIDIISYLLMFVFATIIVRAVVFALDFVTELPVLGILNRMAGVLVGLFIAWIIIGFLYVIITLLYIFPFGKPLMNMIAESPFLNFLYENNVIMTIMTIFR